MRPYVPSWADVIEGDFTVLDEPERDPGVYSPAAQQAARRAAGLPEVEPGITWRALRAYRQAAWSGQLLGCRQGGR